ncbi:MAG: antibiotic biosynthesis monooxygenase family protein [Terriglobales bacterium]
MFTRLVECQPKAGKREELVDKVRSEVLAILQKQPGFVDLIALRDNTDEQRLVYLTFWNTREDADNYHGNYYDRIVSMLKPLLSASPLVETFQVDDSTIHRIAASRAAA